MPKVNIISYGCTANEDNSQIMAGLLDEANFELSPDFIDADIVIINTCAVKQKTDNKIQSKIVKLANNHPEKKLIISGCMPGSEYHIIKKIAPNASLINTNHVTEIVKIANSMLQGEKVELLEFRIESKLNLPKITKDKIYNLQVSEGCLSHCTYCSTKIAKGILKSFPKQDIIQEIGKKVKEGYKRINLTSTDMSCYGLDIKTNLPSLLNDINKIPGNFEVRVGMANPQFIKTYKEDLLKSFDSKNILKFLHIPIQSGSSKVLKEMKRGHSVEDFKDIVNLFRKKYPSISIATDIIVGYPTETQEDFKETLDLIENIKPEVLNISKFSSRPNTPASKLKPIDSKIVLNRSKKLTELYNKYRKNIKR
jgi:threonylcarbamoyladenosine tRNA methylthiotransferase CDKAL1